MSEINILIYEGKNGTRVELKSGEEFETIWANQSQIAEIFDCSRSNVAEHIQNIIKSGELSEKDTCRNFRQASTNQPILHYNLDMIIAVGYRINSVRATQFRIWATKILKEYIVKGFAMDDERLKDPQKNQYFRELLERVREIRASEKLFYQQVRDIYATAIDYEEKKNSEEVQEFFATVRNKLLYAITHKTAAELVLERVNINDENFGLLNWEGNRVRKHDISIATNYLNERELTLLKSLVNQLLEYLEGQTLQNRAITIAEWQGKTDKIIELNDYKILHNAGSVKSDTMKKMVGEKYEVFDKSRKLKEEEEAKKEALNDLRKIENEVKELLKKKPKIAQAKPKK